MSSKGQEQRHPRTKHQDSTLVPPVLQTTNGPRQGPVQNGPGRPFKMEGNAANEISSIKEIEALQQSTISLNRSKRIETVRKKERKKLGIVYHNLSVKIFFVSVNVSAAGEK